MGPVWAPFFISRRAHRLREPEHPDEDLNIIVVIVIVIVIVIVVVIVIVTRGEWRVCRETDAAV